MALDINAIKAKLKALDEGKPKSRKWKPKDEHIVRCLPLPGEEDIAFIIKWHYGVDGGRPMACPGTWGDDCPFCDLAVRLKSWKDEKGRDKPEHVRKMDWEFFKKVDAGVKHYIPVIIRRKDSTEVDGPFLWETTPKTYSSVLRICANDDWNDDHPEGGSTRVVTSLVHGLDLVVRLKKAGQDGNKTSFDLTEVEERKKFSPVFKDSDGGVQRATGLLAKVPVQSDIAKEVTTAEAQRVFDTWHASLSSDPAPAADGGVDYGTNGAETPASGGASVDETVARLEAMLKQ